LSDLQAVTKALSETERIFLLDICARIALDGPGLIGIGRALEGASGPGDADDWAQIPPLGVDWNPILRMVNRMFDRLGQAAGEKEFAKRKAALEDWAARKDRLTEQARREVGRFGSLYGAVRAIADASQRPGADKAELGRRLAPILFALFSPSLETVVVLHALAATESDLAKVAVALAAYRAENGRYPAKLVELSPKYLKVVPKDRLSGKELIYRLEGRGYVLYSVGENLTDDGGVEEPHGKGDMVIGAE